MGLSQELLAKKDKLCAEHYPEVYHDGVSAGEAVLLRYSKFQ